MDILKYNPVTVARRNLNRVLRDGFLTLSQRYVVEILRVERKAELSTKFLDVLHATSLTPLIRS